MTQQQLKNLVASNKIKQVIDELLKLAEQPENQDLHNSVVIQSAKFNQYKQEQINDTAYKEEERVSIGRIRASLLSIIDDLVEKEGVAENALEENTQTVLTKFDQLTQAKNELGQKLDLAQSLRAKRLKSKLAFEHQKITQLEEDLEILKKDWLLSMDNERKRGFERRIQSKDNEIDIIFSDIERIEQQLDK